MKKIILMAILASAMTTFGQQTVLNVPSADITEKGKVFTRVDLSYFPHSTYGALAGNVAYGLGHGLDVGVNLDSFTSHNDGTLSVVPNVKYKLYDPRGEGFFAFIGDKVYLPVHNKSFSGGNYLYLAGGLQIEGGFRVVGGVYNSQNAVAPGNRTGALFSFERTLTQKYSALVDWQSGNGSNGYTALGAGVGVTKRLVLYPAYQLGNANIRHGNHGAVLFVAYQF